MKASKKKQALEEITEKFHDLLATFIHTHDDMLNVIHQISLQCSKVASLRDVFHLIVQLWFGQELISGKAVLSWVHGKRQQRQEDDGANEADEEEEEQVDSDTIQKFLADMAKFEEYLRNLEVPSGEDAAAAEEAGEEYYDEEAY